ncbi:uncharacterized protein (DUF58 family) [Sediminihabitans luteus]|uniref:Uncharacterized protein (DUF58 family) n=1 Tax=Sediminihabitans luteus TaxID=1138585 RepID=A0A2M9CCG9_9CELL|nr:uncharacterized protein (DUF58 family) [Sediminihabitans luteus]
MGGLLVVVGAALSLRDVVGIGAAAVLLVVVSVLRLALERYDRGRGALRVVRRVEPNPTTRGRAAEVTLVVEPVVPTPATRHRLATLDVSEQASRELCTERSLRATVRREPSRLVVTYRLTPARRGVHALGPALAARTDAFGLVRTTRPLGGLASVVVRPRTTPLGTTRHTSAEAGATVSSGAAIASWEDSLVREYVTGDDPRRVHWRSVARRGRLMVRAEEGSGLPPSVVVLDRGLVVEHGPAARVDAGEWAVELAASLAVAMLRSGRPTHLLPSGSATVPTSSSGSAQAVLDSAARVHGATQDEAVTDLVATARALQHQEVRSVVVVAGMVTAEVVTALGRVGATRRTLVLVRPPQSPAEDGVGRLRAHGWHVIRTHPHEAVEQVWTAVHEETP